MKKCEKVTHLGKIVFAEGFTVKKNKHGFGIFSNKDYKAGEVVYIGNFVTLPDDGSCFSYETEEGLFVEEDSETHYVLLHGRRFRFSDCLINHSCDPNLICGKNNTPTTPDVKEGHYEMLALKDIKAGDEFCVDYDLFDWDCTGHKFKCECGAKDCRGEIKGFSELTPENQEKLLPYAEDYIIEMYYKNKQG
jgi:hypothetical protein